MSNARSTTHDDDLKRELDSELSQRVRAYESRGLDPDEIVDSLLWHAEVAMSRDDGSE